MSEVREIPERVQSLVCEHLDEIAFLYGQLLVTAKSPACTLVDYQRFEKRLLAHLEALRIYEDDVVPLAVALMECGSPGELYAAACAALTLGGGKGTAAVERAFASVSPEGREGAAAAISHFATDDFVERWLERAPNLPAACLCSAAGVAAFRRAEKFTGIFQFGLLKSQELPERFAAWKILRNCPAKASSEQTLAGALDENAGVRRLALETAALAGQAWVLDHCRREATKPARERWAELELLSVLARENDVAVVLALAKSSVLGPPRFRLLGTLGMPEGVPLLLCAMSSGSMLEAAVAGEAFTRITGRPLRIVEKIPVNPEDGSLPDEFEMEFLEEASVPDAREAAIYWEEHKSKYSPGQRYSQGLPVPEEKPFSPELDIVAIREACLRAAFSGKPGPQAVDFERVPLTLN